MKRSNKDKLPRDHAYIHMRNRGYRIDIDYQHRDSDQAERMIEAVMSIFGENDEKETENKEKGEKS